MAPVAFPGIDGFLRLLFPTRASIMLDVVFVAMFLVIPGLAISISFAKRGWFSLHKITQLVLGTTLLIAVVAFEVDMQILTEWEKRAEPSPYFAESIKWSCPAGIMLLVHLAFAVPTAGLWVYVIYGALRKFAAPPIPNDHSASHRFWGWLASLGMLGTAVTGWIFYYLAFVASEV